MSTTCRIGLLRPDGKIRSIYCNWDGYPTYVGAVLYFYYKSESKIKKLLALGDISMLGEYLTPPAGEVHEFNSPAPHVVVSYNRDRKHDKFCKVVRTEAIVTTISQLCATSPDSVTDFSTAYLYVFDPSIKKWFTYGYTLNGFVCKNVDYIADYLAGKHEGMLPVKGLPQPKESY